MKLITPPVESTDDLRKLLQQMVGILDMADAEEKPIVRAGLIVLAEDHGKAMLRKFRPFVKATLEDAWPSEEPKDA